MNRSWPDAVANGQRHIDEIRWMTCGRIHDRRGIFLRPAIVVLRDRQQNLIAPWVCLQRDRVFDDLCCEVRVIGLRDEVYAVLRGPDDH
jgi:hypothetical protein